MLEKNIHTDVRLPGAVPVRRGFKEETCYESVRHNVAVPYLGQRAATSPSQSTRLSACPSVARRSTCLCVCLYACFVLKLSICLFMFACMYVPLRLYVYVYRFLCIYMCVCVGGGVFVCALS